MKLRAARAELAIPLERVEPRILMLRRQKVMLDADLAELFGVPTKVLNQAVKRNIARFPQDFMFRLTREESRILRPQSVTSKRGRGGRRYNPFAFTEQGVAIRQSHRYAHGKNGTARLSAS